MASLTLWIFPRETGLILRCAGKAGNSFQTTSMYRLGVAAHGESWPCLQPTPEATSCVVPDVQMFSMVPYVLNITAVHPGGVSSSFVPFVPEHISE